MQDYSRNRPGDEGDEILRQIRAKLQEGKDVPPFNIRAFYESSLAKISRELLKDGIEISYEKLPNRNEEYGDVFRQTTYLVKIFNSEILTPETASQRSNDAEKAGQRLSLMTRYKIFLQSIDRQTNGNKEVFRYYTIPLNLITPDFLDFLREKRWKLECEKIGGITYWSVFW